jgi:phytoene synthase
MISLFEKISYKNSEVITKAYSTSFSIGILFLNKELRKHIYAIYGLVRIADEIVDTMHNIEQRTYLEKFREQTFEDIKNGFSTNPVVNAFRITAQKFNIGEDLIEPFFDSMFMDLYKRKYNEIEYRNYIYGSAEVVGLMCLKVFVNGDESLYKELKPYAQALGSAFQKVNFLRDVKNDFEVLNRAYFPDVDFANLTENDRAKIIEDIEKDFQTALIGIRKLPKSSKLGVLVAYEYYRKLLEKIRKLPAEEVLKKRIRINNFIKFILLFKVILKKFFNKY